MSNEVIQIDLSKLRILKSGLDDISEEKFPRAVKKTLNNMAFYMKGTRGRMGRIQTRARGEFDYERNKTFIKALTGVEKATGNDVDKMSAGAGVYSRSGKERAASGLAQQQDGGAIKHGFTPLAGARISGSKARKVSGPNKHQNLNFVDLTKFRKEKMMRGLILAQRVGRPVYIKGRSGKRNYIAKPMGKTPQRFANGNSRVRLKFLYMRNVGGVARLRKKVPFVKMAGVDAFEKFDEYFLDEFDYIFDKR